MFYQVCQLRIFVADFLGILAATDLSQDFLDTVHAVLSHHVRVIRMLTLVLRLDIVITSFLNGLSLRLVLLWLCIKPGAFSNLGLYLWALSHI